MIPLIVAAVFVTTLILIGSRKSSRPQPVKVPVKIDPRQARRR